MAADAFELGEHPGYEAANPVRVGNMACERFELDIFGEVVGMMSVGAEVLCRIAGRLAEEYVAGERGPSRPGRRIGQKNEKTPP
jgi:hypothetical protein